MKPVFTCFFFSFIWQAALAQNIRAGLYTAASVKEFQFSIGSGGYLLTATMPDGHIEALPLHTLAQGRFKCSGTFVQFYQGGVLRLQASQMELLQLAHEDFCNWSVPALAAKTRAYE